MFFSGIADEAGEGIDVQIKAHKELGWEHIELRNIHGVNITDLCDETYEEVREKVKAGGLEVSDFGSQLCNWARPIIKHPDIDIEELQRAVPRMNELGCRFIRVMSYPNAGLPEAMWKKEVFKRMRKLVDIAEDHSIVLLHENCDGWAGQGPEQTLELVEAMNSSSFKLVWDTGNPVAHDQDAWKYYEEVRDHIAYVHIKDAVRCNGELNYTFPGEGEGKVKEVLSDLKNRGYHGGVSIEPHLAAIMHEGKKASSEEDSYQLYVEYGKRLMKIVENLE